ncbi:MAG TPA: FAD-binding oxidoreductase [Candidatus Binatia bacterium]|nr:FAD-binding oxidoreductase [Candidatus Binatia bacterium]
MDAFFDVLKQKGFTGETDTSDETRELYSHDASLFELKPQAVVFPKNTADIERLVQAVNDCKAKDPSLSLTGRSAGTDMGGGSISDSISVDFRRYFAAIEEVTSNSAHLQPGVLYKDFEKASLEKGALLPSFPASRELCSVGGMVANNSGGEKSLEFGKTENFVTQLEMVLSDGKAHIIKPLTREELESKKAQQDLMGSICRGMYELLDKNYDLIKKAKPHVTKNSTGYNLWDVWDRETGIFDLTKLMVGSQGTLGLVTDINLRLINDKPHSGVLVAFMKNTDNLGEVINAVMPQKPASFEAFDNYTLILAIKFFFYFRKTLGWGGLIKLGLQLIPDGFLLLRGIPKMILLIEFTGETPNEVKNKVHAMRQILKPFKLEAMEEDSTEAKAWKFRIMRRESFNLLRKKVKDKHTAPYIDDMVVPPEHLTKFLPELRAIINKYKLFATVAGHMGDGNFHVIPLMKIEDPKELAKIQPSMREVNELILKYGGSLSGEHNDGMIRGPWLEQMYGKQVVDLFRQTKQIFDPQNIFNPHKKTDATWEFSMSHVREHF